MAANIALQKISKVEAPEVRGIITNGPLSQAPGAPLGLFIIFIKQRVLLYSVLITIGITPKPQDIFHTRQCETGIDSKHIVRVLLNMREDTDYAASSVLVIDFVGDFRIRGRAFYILIQNALGRPQFVQIHGVTLLFHQ